MPSYRIIDGFPQLDDKNVNTGTAIASGGTTRRTIPEFFGDTVNVKDTGAAGNGLANDTASISAAIARIPATGGVVWFPRGTYLISGSFTLPPGATVRCDDGAEILCATGFSSVDSTVFLTTASDVTFLNVTVDARSVTNPPNSIVASAGGSRLSVVGCQFFGKSSQPNVIAMYGGEDHAIEGNLFSGGVNAFNCYCTSGTKKIRVAGNNFNGFINSIYFTTDISGSLHDSVWIESNYVDGIGEGGQAITFQVPEAWTSDPSKRHIRIHIIDNKCFGPQISLQSGGAADLIGAYFLKDSIVSRNLAIGGGDTGVSADGCTNTVFSENVCKFNSVYGMQITSCTDCVVVGGSYIDNGLDQSGTYPTAKLAGVAVINSDGYGNTSSGIVVSGILATDDQTVKTQKYGLYIEAGCSGTTVGICRLVGNKLGEYLDDSGSAVAQINASAAFSGTALFSGDSTFNSRVRVVESGSIWQGQDSGAGNVYSQTIINTLTNTLSIQITKQGVAYGAITLNPIGGSVSIAAAGGLVGFFGVNPVSQQTGDVLSGLSALGLFTSPTIAYADVSGLGTAATHAASDFQPAGSYSPAAGSSSITTVGTIASGTWHGSTIAPSYGGTGLNGGAASDGSLLIGNGSGFTLSTLTAGSGISIVNSAGGVAISATGGTGTVTSVGMSVPSWLTVANSPVTTSGTLAVTANGGQAANLALMTPNGSTGAVSLRSVLQADVSGLTTADAPTFAGGVFNGNVGINTNSPLAQLHIYGSSTFWMGLEVGAGNVYSQTTLDTTLNALTIQVTKQGVAYGSISLNPNGGNVSTGGPFLLAAVADADAPNGSLFKGSDHSAKLCFKDDSGTVHVLY